MPTITINADLCRKCGMCLSICPASVYIQETKESIPEVTNTGFCISCGHCVAICPHDAIIHSEFPEDSVKLVNTENMPSPGELIELLRTRRSVRLFKDKPVEKELIERIIDAARFAPSAHNLQTTEYIVIQDKELLREIVQATSRYYQKLISQLHNPLIRPFILLMMRKQARTIIDVLLPGLEQLVLQVQRGKDRILRNAPALMLAHADERTFSMDVNAHLALQNTALMIHAQGLGSYWTGYLVGACERDKSLQQLINLPKNHRVYGGLAIGYPQFKFEKWPERKIPKITWL
jgi:nitroreductase/Pyruvate/2-oxoacid:ferredoxin oxidoreductase delta subunit